MKFAHHKILDGYNVIIFPEITVDHDNDLAVRLEKLSEDQEELIKTHCEHQGIFYREEDRRDTGATILIYRTHASAHSNVSKPFAKNDFLPVSKDVFDWGDCFETKVNDTLNHSNLLASRRESRTSSFYTADQTTRTSADQQTEYTRQPPTYFR